jgi:hypothetical protein
LERIAPEVRATLRQAAVLGREFTTAALAAQVDQQPELLTDVLDAAVAAELVVAVDAHRYQFAHVLTQEVMYAELPTAERQRAHAQAALALRPSTAGAFSRGGGASPASGRADRRRRRGAAGPRAAAVGRNQLAYERAAFQYREAVAPLALLPGGDAPRLGCCWNWPGASSVWRVEEAWRPVRRRPTWSRGR